MLTIPPSVRLRGRDTELRVLGAALDGARARRGTSLLLTGGPGTGRTALLDHVRADADDFTALSAAGVADEADVPLAGLQRLLTPIEPAVDLLAEPRRGRLREALVHGNPGDRFGLGTGVLDLLARAAEERPLLLTVDDADLLDRDSLDALAFVARRLVSTRVALVMASRATTVPRAPGGGPRPLVPGVDEHVLAPLGTGPVHDVLTAAAPVTLAQPVRSALVAASHGNPAALVGLLDALTHDQLTGAEPLPEPLLLPARLRTQLLEPVRDLPGSTRRLLLLAALGGERSLTDLLGATGHTRPDAAAPLEPAAPGPAATHADGPDHSVLDATGRTYAARPDAADHPAALEPAEERGLVRVHDGAVRFTDPLLRDALAQDAPVTRAREAHRALAVVTDQEHDPVAFARHTAEGAAAPDTGLSDAVHRAAHRADRVEGRTAASLAFERAARLTPDPDTRACRTATAAYQACMAGNTPRAAGLVARARPLAVSDRRHAIIDLIDAQLAMRDQNSIDVAERLLRVGRGLVPHDRPLALRALVRSADSASLAGDPVRHAHAVDLALPLVRDDDPAVMHRMADFLEGCAISFRGDYTGSTPILRRAVRLADGDAGPSELIWAGIAGLRLADNPFVRGVTTRAAERCRVRGEQATMPAALGFLVFSEFWSGRFPSAAGTALTGLRVSRSSGQGIWATHHLASLAMIAAIQGDVETCQIRARAVASQAGEKSLGLAAAVASWGSAVLELSRGNAAEAFFRLRSLANAGPGQGHPTMRLLTAPHFVEAATRMGETAWAAASLAGYRRWADSVDSPSALALAARCEALLAGGDEAVDHFETALALHRTGGDDDVEHARTQLLFGAHLRRARLPGRAREHLHNAQESFERFGARLWVRQARAELRALGTADRGPDLPATSELTAQQQQIASLVAEGATNREVAAHLFISPRTVEHHLRGIFRKLNIRSRVDLARLLN